MVIKAVPSMRESPTANKAIGCVNNVFQLRTILMYCLFRDKKIKNIKFVVYGNDKKLKNSLFKIK